MAQDYPNFELLISDNASTDDTQDIIRAYAERDSRVRVVRHAENKGAPANFNFVFHETDGPYFMWAADDDRWEPGYVSACVAALQARSDAVLACTKIRFMDETGGPGMLDGAMYDNSDLSCASLFQRIRVLLSRGAWYQIYGLIRRDALVRTRLAGNAFGADVVLLVELAAQGKLVRVPDVLFHYRLFQQRIEHDRGGWHESIANRDRARLAPYTHLQDAISDAISVADLSPLDKLRARLGMISALYVERTRIRAWIADEIGIRLRMAVRDRELRGVIKYAFLSFAVHIRRFLGRILRRL